MTNTAWQSRIAVMAAQVSMKADEILGRDSPADIKELAATPPEEILDDRPLDR